MHFLAPLHRATSAFGGFHELAREARVHRLLAALLRSLAYPAHRERRAPHRADFHRNLIICPAHPSALHLDHGLHVLDRLAEDLERVLAGLRFDRVEGVVDDVLRDGFLAAGHEHVDELRDVGVSVLRVGKDLALGDFSAAWHGSFSKLSSTQPWVSSRRTWSDPACD